MVDPAPKDRATAEGADLFGTASTVPLSVTTSSLHQGRSAGPTARRSARSAASGPTPGPSTRLVPAGLTLDASNRTDRRDPDDGGRVRLHHEGDRLVHAHAGRGDCPLSIMITAGPLARLLAGRIRRLRDRCRAEHHRYGPPLRCTWPRRSSGMAGTGDYQVLARRDPTGASSRTAMLSSSVPAAGACTSPLPSSASRRTPDGGGCWLRRRRRRRLHLPAMPSSTVRRRPAPGCTRGRHRGHAQREGILARRRATAASSPTATLLFSGSAATLRLARAPWSAWPSSTAVATGWSGSRRARSSPTDGAVRRIGPGALRLAAAVTGMAATPTRSAPLLGSSAQTAACSPTATPPTRGGVRAAPGSHVRRGWRSDSPQP